MSIYIKKCQWCLQDFETKNQKQLNCKTSHGVYMSQYRNGKRQAPLIWNKVEEEIKAEFLPQKIEELTKKLSTYKKEFEAKCKEYFKVSDNIGSDFNHPMSVELIEKRLLIMRTKEKIVDLSKPKLKVSKKLLSASELPSIKRSKKLEVNYPFDKPFFGKEYGLSSYFDNNYRMILMTLGTLPKPFLGLLIENENEAEESFYSFKEYLMWLCGALLIFYRSKIIYVVSSDEIEKGFYDGLTAKKINDPNLFILEESDKKAITKTILEEQPEFLLIDIDENLDLKFFKDLREVAPKTSVFCIIKSMPKKKLMGFANLVTMMEEDGEKHLKGGNKKYWDDWYLKYE